MRIMLYVCAGLLTATMAAAGPITAGPWTLAPGPNEAGLAPFAQPSEDGPLRNIWYVLGPQPGLEYVYAPFTFPEWDGVTVFGLTAYTNTLSRSVVGAFLFESPEGIYASDGIGWMNFLLLRRALSPTTTQYWVCGEDHDGVTHRRDDCQDIVQMFIETVPDTGEGGGSVPEPASIALFGLALLAVRRRLQQPARCGTATRGK